MFNYVLTYDFMHKVGSALQQPRHALLLVLQAAALSQKGIQGSLAASAQRRSATGFCRNNGACSLEKGAGVRGRLPCVIMPAL